MNARQQIVEKSAGRLPAESGRLLSNSRRPRDGKAPAYTVPEMTQEVGGGNNKVVFF